MEKVNLLIRVIIDSGIDENKTMKEIQDYERFPLSVTLGDESYLDGVEIELEAVYDYMRQGNLPKTSQVSFESIINVLDKCREREEDAIYIGLSSKFSGTFQLVQQVMAAYQEKYPTMKLAAVDSGGGAGGGAMIAAQAMKMVREGFSFEEIVRQAEWSAKHVHYLFTLDNLEWLVKGGRLPKVAGAAGSALNIKPYLTIGEKGIEVAKLMRGQKRVFKRMVEDVQNGINGFTDQVIAISHADDEENAKKIEQALQQALPEVQTEILQIGAVLGTHLGIGGIGVFYYDERPEHYID